MVILMEIKKMIEKLTQKQAQFNSGKVEVFPFGNLSQNLAFTAGVLANYEEYETLYYTSVDVSTAIDLLSQYAVTEFEFTGPPGDVRSAQEFARKNNLRSRLTNLVRTMLIYGNAYDYIAEAGGNQITLQYLNPKKVTAIIDTYGDVTGYKYTAGSDKILDTEQVMHFAYGRLGNSPYGYSITHQVHDLIALKQTIERVGAVLAHRMSHPMLHAKCQNPGKIDEVAKLLKERVNDVDTVEGVEILNELVTDDKVTIETLSTTTDISSITRVLEYLQKQIDKALKVPAVFYGEAQTSNRATSYNQLKTFSLLLSSIQSILKEELEKKLFPAMKINAELVFPETIIEDELVWGQMAVQLYQAGIADLDEARAYVGLSKKGEE